MFIAKVKYKLILSALFICLFISAKPQSDSIRNTNFIFGFHGGLSLITDTLKPIRESIYEVKPCYSFAIGVLVSNRLYKNTSVEFGVLYNKLNGYWRYNYFMDPWTYFDLKEVSLKLHYLSFPLSVSISLNKFKIGLGIQYSTLIKNIAIIHETHQYYRLDTNYVQNNIFLKNNNLSILSFISYSLSNRLSVDLKLNLGLLEITNSKKGWINNSHTRQLLLGIKYQLLSTSKK